MVYSYKMLKQIIIISIILMSSVFAEKIIISVKKSLYLEKLFFANFEDKIKEGNNVNQKCKMWGYNALFHIMRKIERSS